MILKQVFLSIFGESIKSELEYIEKEFYFNFFMANVFKNIQNMS